MNEKDLIDNYARMVAEKARQNFMTNAKGEDECFEGSVAQIESPVERSLCLALLVVKTLNNLSLTDPQDIPPLVYISGVDIEPQFKVGKYSIDFRISNHETIGMFNNGYWKKCAGCDRSVLIECDSQEWHERTEEERRYEKARDRYLVKKGFTVFHYTGKEILKNPIKIAEEIFTFVGCRLDEIMV